MIFSSYHLTWTFTFIQPTGIINLPANLPQIYPGFVSCHDITESPCTALEFLQILSTKLDSEFLLLRSQFMRNPTRRIFFLRCSWMIREKCRERGVFLLQYPHNCNEGLLRKPSEQAQYSPR